MGNARMVAVAGAMLAILAGGPAVAQQARYAERGATGGYGGGLIEFLVTGRADRPTGNWPQAARAAQPSYGAQPRYAAQPNYAGPPAYVGQPNVAVQRQAALIAGDRVPPYGEPSTMPYAAALPEPEPVYAPQQAYAPQPDPRRQDLPRAAPGPRPNN